MVSSRVVARDMFCLLPNLDAFSQFFLKDEGVLNTLSASDWAFWVDIQQIFKAVIYRMISAA